MKLRLPRRRTPPNATGRQRPLRSAGQYQAPPTFAYRSRRAPTTTAPAASRRTGHFWLQRLGSIILLIAAAAAAVNVLSVSTMSEVRPLNQSSNPLLRDPTVYERAADKLLRSSVWNRDKLTINTDQLRRGLINQFPELSSVSITLPLLAHRPVIYLAASQPTLILVNGSGSFVVDDRGKALVQATAATLRQLPQLPLVHDQSGLGVQLDHQALPATSVSFMQTVLAELADKHFSVSALTLPSAANELDVQLAGQPYFVKFNLESNTPREQAGTFLATIAQLQRQNIMPAKYIDVRVEGRAYYQ